MAKKKNQGKKHKFKHADSAGQVAASGLPAASGSAVQAGAPVPKLRRDQAGAAVATRDFSYVGADLRRIAVLAISLIGLELVLWYLFGHTGVGDTVYNLVKV